MNNKRAKEKILAEEAVKAMDDGDCDKIKMKKEFIEKFNDIQYDGQSLLMVAVSKQNTEVVEYLLKSKVDIEYRQSINESDLFVDKQDIADYLVNSMPKPPPPKKPETGLDKLVDVIQRIDDYCSSPEEFDIKKETQKVLDDCEYTALYLACLNKSAACADQLL